MSLLHAYLRPLMSFSPAPWSQLVSSRYFVVKLHTAAIAGQSIIRLLHRRVPFSNVCVLDSCAVRCENTLANLGHTYSESWQRRKQFESMLSVWQQELPWPISYRTTVASFWNRLDQEFP